MQTVLLVAAGGAIGATGRYLVNLAFARSMEQGFPWATLTVNIAGSLLMGALAALLVLRLPDATGLRLFLLTGVLGGFTTFSAFSLEFAALIERGAVGMALAYALASVILSIAACFAGLVLSRSLLS